MKQTNANHWVIIGSLWALLTACSGAPESQPVVPGIDAPREISKADTTACRELGLVVKRSARYNQDKFDTQQAMSAALDAVLEAGGDSYRLLDVTSEGSGRGTQVILEAYRCF
jgi:hypothetical protein